MATAIGSKVRFVKAWDNYPDAFIEAGETGTLIRLGNDGEYWVKLDKHHDTLDAWNNEVELWDYSNESPNYHPETYFIALPDPHAICRKWVSRLGLGFHPDTRGKDYIPVMSAAEVADYDADMEALFKVASDPYECGIMAMKDASLI